MSFRDDHEAAIARADAAERELARVKQELEEARRPKPEPPKPEPKRDPKPPRKPLTSAQQRAWILGVASVVGTIALIAGLIFGGRACARHRVMNGAGRLDSAHVVQTADGQDRLVVVSEVHDLADDSDISPWRIDLIDPATGKRVLRKADLAGRARPELQAATPGRMWCDLDGDYVGDKDLIEVCDVATLGVVISRKQLVAKNPAFASGFAYSGGVDPVTKVFYATTNTGETIQIDARDGIGRPASGDAGRGLPSIGQSQYGTTGSLDDLGGYGFHNVDGGPRLGLFRGTSYPKDQRIGTETFLHPDVLARYGGDNEAIVLPDKAVVLVHRDTLDDHAAKLLFSHLSLADGKLAWTATYPAGSVKMGMLHGDTVIFALEINADVSSLIIGLDGKTGAERWRYEI